MPGIFYQPTSRRDFLSSALKFSAVAATFTLPVSSRDTKPTLRYALVSDTHVAADAKNVYRGFYPAENFKRTIDQVSAWNPAGTLINGDVARLDGQQGDYAAIKEIAKPLVSKSPLFMGLGNHDDRKNFSALFPAFNSGISQVKDKHVLVLEHEPVRLIILDSLYQVNVTPGFLGRAQRIWLEGFLSAKSTPKKPTLLFVHHTLGQNDGELLDAAYLLAFAERQKQIKAIFYGHSHQYNYKKLNGLHLVNLPATGYNFSDAEPVGWVSAEFSRRDARLTLNAFAGNTKVNGTTTILKWRS